ncbi:aldose 1-epimerase family protein [Sphingomonas sp. 10B4]|uniref:aldose 1-epimerase family protein n=1 Tax=Sphingomonas sp. 10B4 TaxID=3048575 RepID=UPI002AB3703F|nr:aldose 1-epimerase family protein [Sphingomonas sp. 10B4]MDY7523988.1 aldose 1-epimerase family protein [Sphingomonas sp. 10B4]MEB0282154.1 aldose 1-epimerase family protein [Sphingomonas sp. 10B4]
MPEAALIEIGSAELTAAINPYGAELTHLRDGDGRELMTDADPAFWTGHAPILFPIVGALNGDTLRLDGESYTMGKHGFARRSTFAVVEHSATRAVFLLEDSAETLAVYPRKFALRLTYAIDGATLAMTAEIENRERERTLPASFGFHPAFAWPLPYGAPRADHRIVFAADEPEALRALTPGGLIVAQQRPTPLEGGTLALRDALFEQDALIWDAVRSQSVRYGAETGPQLRVDFPDTPMLGIWTKPGAAYVCIEPWHGIADPADFTGDFTAKPGVFALAPGETKTIAMHVTLEP